MAKRETVDEKWAAIFRTALNAQREAQITRPVRKEER